ncbi:MAG: hypothetical protein D3904_08360 [Candidatus Electrothrix sp. EH2]|nr:hypothetical protein [Candidatus Electrothrix sp. EH2]
MYVTNADIRFDQMQACDEYMVSCAGELMGRGTHPARLGCGVWRSGVLPRPDYILLFQGISAGVHRIPIIQATQCPEGAVYMSLLI